MAGHLMECRRARVSWLVWALVLGACQATTGATTTATTTIAPAVSMPETGPTSVTAPDDPLFVYRVGIFGQPELINPWGVWDINADVFTEYVNPPSPSLYTYQGPTYTMVPMLAADDSPPPVVADDGGWSVTISLRGDVTWSDGTAVTASDVEFTFETVARLGMGNNYLTVWPVAAADDPATEEDEARNGIVSVEALGHDRVVIRFNFDPGLGVWPHGVGVAPVFSEGYWRPHAEAAIDGASLQSIDGVGGPTTGAFVSSVAEPGAFWTHESVAGYWDRGSRYVVYENGAVEYTGPSGRAEWFTGPPAGDRLADYVEGPYAESVIYSYYGDQNSAVLALVDGEIDYLLNPLGLDRGLQQLVLGASDLDVAVNDANGFMYLAFNTRKFPMSEKPFRRAVACMIDKEFVANDVLGGATIPLDSLVPPGNAFWSNPDVAAPCSGMSAERRLAAATDMLRSAGWTWDVEPLWDEQAGDVDPQGKGLRGPDGTPVPPLTLLTPGPSFDPLRVTHALYVEQWAVDLGIPVTAEPTGFLVIAGTVWNASEVAEWDMYILGWALTPFPDHVFAFFRSETDIALGGFNNTGYSSPELDALAARFDDAKTTEEARELVFQAEEILADDLPYVVLYSTPIIEAYRATLEFPFTAALGGIQGFLGLPASVQRR